MNSQDAQALNATLQDIAAAIRTSASAQETVLKTVAESLDLSFLTLRAMAHSNQEFRITLLQCAQEDAVYPIAEGLRARIREMISDVQKATGGAPNLKSV